MLKMGQMCHCGRATLWKVDIDDGSIVFTADRGQSRSYWVDLYDDGSDIYLYESGVSAATKKWLDGGSSVSEEWSSSAGGISAKTISFRAPDGAVWVLSETTYLSQAERIDDSDGSVDASSTSVFGTWPHAFPGASSGFYSWYFQDNASPFLRRGHVLQYDNSVTKINESGALSTTPNEYGINPIDGDPSNGLLTVQVTLSGSDPAKTTKLTTSLGIDSQVSFGAGTVAGANQGMMTSRSNSNGYCIAAFNGISSGGALSINESTLGVSWDVALGNHIDLANCRMDSSESMYIVDNNVIKKESSGGSDWNSSSTLTSATINWIHLDETAGYLIAAGAFTISGSTKHLAALSLSTGAVQWSIAIDGYDGIDSLRHFVIYDGYIYACGDRT